MSAELLYQKFAGKMGYPEKDMNPPPSEKRPSVVQFSLTEGCAHAGCTFCTMYERGRGSFKTKTPEEFRQHVDLVMEYLKEDPERLKPKRRIFLGAGNALSAPTDTLLDASQYALQKLYKARKFTLHESKSSPRRLSVYGNTKDILEKEVDDLTTLRCGGACGNCSVGRFGEKHGVDVVYWGIESGSDPVLKIAGKGYSKLDILTAGRHLSRADIKRSVMIMPGLGGVKMSDTHTADTISVLNGVAPEWTTFIGLAINSNTPYSKWMERQEESGENRRMTPPEIALQTAAIIRGLNYPTIIGVHGPDVHPFGYNPVNIPNSIKINNESDRDNLAKEIESRARAI